MSRIGKRILTIPEGVNVNVDNSIVTVQGPKGQLSLKLVDNISITVEDNKLTVNKRR